MIKDTTFKNSITEIDNYNYRSLVFTVNFINIHQSERDNKKKILAIISNTLLEEVFLVDIKCLELIYSQCEPSRREILLEQELKNEKKMPVAMPQLRVGMFGYIYNLEEKDYTPFVVLPRDENEECKNLILLNTKGFEVYSPFKQMDYAFNKKGELYLDGELEAYITILYSEDLTCLYWASDMFAEPKVNKYTIWKRE